VTLVDHTPVTFDDAAMPGCDAVITHDARMKPALGVDVVPLA